MKEKTDNARKWRGAAALLTLAVCMLAAMCWPGRAEAASKAKLNATKKVVYIGTPYTLEVTGTWKSITWSSSNKKVATVSAEGVVKGKKSGTATITATIGGKGGQKLPCKVTVRQPVTSVKLNKEKILLTEKGEKKRLKATVRPSAADYRRVKWSSSNKRVATVTQDGTVKAVRPGNCYIYATAADRGELVATCTVTVFISGKKAKESDCMHTNRMNITEPCAVPTVWKKTDDCRIVNGTDLKVTYICSCGKKFCGENKKYKESVEKLESCVRMRYDDGEAKYWEAPASLRAVPIDVFNNAKKLGKLASIENSDLYYDTADPLLIENLEGKSKCTAEWFEKNDSGYKACMEHVAAMEKKGKTHTWTLNISYDPAPEIAHAGTRRFYENHQVKLVYTKCEPKEEARMSRRPAYTKCLNCGKVTKTYTYDD